MDSLVFITTQTAAVPNGRNARIKARAERARISNPAKQQQGRFGTLDFGVEPSRCKLSKARNRRRTERDPKPAATGTVDPRLQWLTPSTPIVDRRLIQWERVTVLSHDFDDVLAIARHHVRRSAAQIAYMQPWRMAEALRCRQWAVAPFTFRRLHATEPVTSAYAFLVTRLQHVIFDRSAPSEAFTDNAEALRSLQAALVRPSAGGSTALVPAAWLLALGELLNFEHSKDWRTHAAGTTALLKAGLADSKSSGDASLTELMPPMLEAFLSHGDAVLANEPWQAVIRPLISEHINDGALANFIASRLITTAALIAEGNALKVATCLGDPHWTVALSLLDRANKARESVKHGILEMQSQSSSRGRPDTDVVGLCLAALFGLDTMIKSLQPQPGHVDNGYDHEADTLKLCTQILQDELKRDDARPSAPLLLAFERHGTLSALVPPTMELRLTPP